MENGGLHCVQYVKLQVLNTHKPYFGEICPPPPLGPPSEEGDRPNTSVLAQNSFVGRLEYYKTKLLSVILPSAQREKNDPKTCF